jgi:predicted Zn-dependent protease
VQTAAAKYGLAFISLKLGEYDKAQALLQEAYAAAQGPSAPIQDPMLSSLSIDIKLALGRAADAVREADAARVKFPLSRGIARQYADGLIATGRYDEAVAYLRDQVQLYRQEPQLQDQLAKAYAAQGRQALQHLALAESYALNGALPAALDQLNIARRAPDASFYDQAMIDARERDLRTQWREQMKDGQRERFQG